MWPMTVILRALAILSGLGTAGCLIWATYVRTLYHPDRYGQYIHALDLSAFWISATFIVAATLFLLSLITDWLAD